MKLARCTDGGAPFWGVVDVDAGTVAPIAGRFDQWAPRITRGEGVAALTFAGATRPLTELRLLAPIERVSKVVIAGANYNKHLVEFGLKPPGQPFSFLKAHGALIGANDPIRYPPLTEQLDHEVELVAVIGALELDHDDPLASVLGYTVGNDVSSRDLQNSGPPGIGMDLYSGKSGDLTTGVGPWIVTRDEFPAGSPRLRLTLAVNGEIRQDGSTAEMTWGVDELLRFIDQRVSFECGDIMFTGSPAGVGMGTGIFLNPGDVVEATVEGIGTLKNIVGPKGPIKKEKS
jgi:2-keto-4-pentenoate hydratase/2-oxohepta-3-ene-1,7-dioic acid hydratase in catechol pathway